MIFKVINLYENENVIVEAFIFCNEDIIIGYQDNRNVF